MLKKISITGAESTGKTTLTKDLAQYFEVDYVPEFARIYFEKNAHKNYTEQDVWNIAKGQIALENEICQKTSKNIIFIDTDLTVLKIWLEHAYSRIPLWLENTYKTQYYDYYLLTKPDIDWEFDVLREHPYLREVLHARYYAELVSKKKPFSIIQGVGKERMENAISIIENFLKE